ncbi:Transcription factor EB [Fasciola hepatica]|uniref:Transcription factor EB n=1 Tax=Fasciola hepatica TaxID=6192 RepID=A0A4E0S3E6_FASHE|nr:Transcription factor EB [Fasciola hepatica]
MESCFPNIAEDQESDSFDLNNITPSIHLSSSFGVPGEFLTSYDHPHLGTVDGGIDRDTVRISSSGNSQRLGLRMTQPNELTSQVGMNTNPPSQPAHHLLARNQPPHQTHPLRRGIVAKTDEDDLVLSKASTSCPAEMHDPVPGFGASPLQSNTAYHITQPSSSGGAGSGGSLGGNSTNDGISMGHGGGGGPGSLLYASPNSLARSCDDQRVAWDRDRTKKDSHNRIERKRRDYINCQISELGNLLPEEMFRDGDCKKNKGSILKNSVEFICLLRSELAQVPDVRKETILAAKVIGQLTKRIQELEMMSGASPGNLEYQRTLQEWLLLHEHNLQNRTTVSPGSKPSFLYRVDGTGRCSSPGLSSLGTEDVSTADTKSVFSGSGLLPGSAPAPSAPLNTCPRLQSPVSGVSANPRLSAGAIDSPLRMMRTRCTSLTVAGTSPFPGVELTQAQQQQQQHPHLQPQLTPQSTQQQRIVIGQPLRGVPATTTSLHQPGQSRGSPLLPLHNRPWPQAPQTDSRLSGQQLSPQRTLHPQHRRNQVTRPLELLQGSTDQDMLMCTGLSASLPAHVNPLLCGLPDCDEGKVSDRQLLHVYSFERDEFLMHLKAEPLSEADSSRASELGYSNTRRSSADQTFPDATTNGIVLEPVLHNNSPLGPNRVSSHDAAGSGSIIGSATAVHHTSGTTNFVSDMTLDSPTQLAFEADDFRFDDVVME